MRSYLTFVLAVAVGAWTAYASAALNVFATVPEWGALVEELAGDKAKIYIATNALQDPHHVEAKPSLIARARGADLVVATGAELEIGWLPPLITQSSNPRIQVGAPGYWLASLTSEQVRTDLNETSSVQFFSEERGARKRD
jgi:zinc/manganese transport system substrate-binding protein